MSTPILVPSVNSSTQPLKVSLWLTHAGEEVTSGDRVVELLIPGVTFDVEAPCAGRIVSCECQAGAEVTTGMVLGWIEPLNSETDLDWNPED
ncbi:biotin/lipoyl-containing protein [Gimesia sp.]|uniref:biotin/lipoyl-containing protein n=1 Tax=Gimesia sp. TaxID=2024833 RepID=UPI003A907936